MDTRIDRLERSVRAARLMKTFSRSLRLTLFVAALACAAPPLSAQVDAVPRPVADHHMHLQSRAVWQLLHGQLPVIALPADLDAVLREFERGWREADNKITLSELFAEDGILQFGDDWLRGRAAVRMMLVGKVGGLRLHPQAFEANETLGHIAGAFGFYRDTIWVDQGRFMFALRRAKGGPWRITMVTLPNVTPPVPPLKDPITADDLIAQLDSGGVRRGVALSSAYLFGAAYNRVENEAAKVRAENDWVGREAARYPGRLVAFCSVNPLKDYAVAEIDRCLRDPNITGLKLHLTTSFVDFRIPAHVDRLRAAFRAANARRVPVIVHMRTMHPAYGRVDAEIFLREVLPEAPDIPVQIAHLAGWGTYGDQSDAALAVFADAVAAGDRRTTNLYFDVSQIVAPNHSDEMKQLIVRRIRQIGVQRMLFAVDGAESQVSGWKNFRLLPLSDSEFRVIAGNLAPYLR